MSIKEQKISVIIPHYNGEDILRDCLKSLMSSTEVPLEIIVVDNASTDSSMDMVRRDFPDVKIVSLSENLGFAGGCNVGIRESSAEYVLILNNDTVHESGWIEHLLSKIESDISIAAVQPKLISYQDNEYFDYSGAAGGEMDIFCFPFARGRIFEYVERDTGQYDSLSDRIFWASGTAFLARRDVLIEAGLFDENFFAHMEEIDLQWRLQLMGYKIVTEPKAVVKHRSGYTLGAESPLKKYLNHRNSLFMMITNYRPLLAIYLLPIRIFLDYTALIQALFRRDFGRSFAIIRAHLWVASHPVKIFRKRGQIKSIRKLKDREILQYLYHGSIALNYYLLDKKKYLEIFLD